MRRLRLLALAAALALPVTLPAGAQTAQPDRKAIEAIVKDYLLKNPEVIQEAMTELERRKEEQQKQAQAAALKESRELLVNSPRGVLVGNPTGDVTMVEFFDYNCGFCKRALGDLRTLMKADPKLRVVLKDFPVLGPESVEASKIAVAAKMQLKGDRLFEYHSKLLDSRGRVNGERALAVAKEMGLDMAKLQRDVGGEDVAATIQENAVLGDKLGLSGTPAYIIGDEIIPGAVGVEPLTKTIASVRRCGRAAC